MSKSTKELIEYLESKPDFKDVPVETVKPLVEAVKEVADILINAKRDTERIFQKNGVSLHYLDRAAENIWLKKHGFETK